MFAGEKESNCLRLTWISIKKTRTCFSLLWGRSCFLLSALGEFDLLFSRTANERVLPAGGGIKSEKWFEK